MNFANLKFPNMSFSFHPLSRKLQWAIVICLLLVSSSALLVVHAEGNQTGQWMVEPYREDAGRVQLTLRYNERGDREREDGWGSWGSTQSHAVDVASLAGLTAAEMNSAGTHV